MLKLPLLTCMVPRSRSPYSGETLLGSPGLLGVRSVEKALSFTFQLVADLN